MYQHWDLIIVAVSVLNTYTAQDLNSLDAYTSFMYCIRMSRIHWWQGMRGQTIHALLLMCYAACNMTCAYIAIAYLQLIEYFTKFLKQLY